MKAIHLTAYGNPAQSLKMVEVSEPLQRPPFSERSLLFKSEASFCHRR